MNKFTTDFLRIANNPADFAGNEPARLIYAAIEHYAECHDITRADAVAYLSTRSDYGSNGRVGGVNARWVDDTQSDYDIEYTTSDVSTWMPLAQLVDQTLNAEPNFLPGWFEPEWINAATGA